MAVTLNGKTYEDKETACVDCGRPFVWTAGEQSFYDEKGFTPPKRCKPCRASNRADKEQKRAERSMPDEPRTGRRDKRR